MSAARKYKETGYSGPVLPNNKIRLIRVAMGKIGMDEDEYRELLGSFGLKSTKQLNPGQFDELMDHFRMLGFESEKGREFRKIGNLPEPKQRYMGKIDAVRRDLGLPWKYVDGMAEKRFGVERVQWAGAGELFKVMQMMIIHQRRQERKAMNPQITQIDADGKRNNQRESAPSADRTVKEVLDGGASDV